MGITCDFAKFIAEARLPADKFESVLMVGRQEQYFTPEDLAKLALLTGFQGERTHLLNEKYIDQTLKSIFAARQVTSLDCSDYEQAQIIHDMNHPIPDHLEEQYDVVIDGGSLEHVFHFPTAISNEMRLLKAGGSLFIFTPANNHMGHGFYQFSPELFFRVFQPANGFKVQRLSLMPHRYPSVEKSRNHRMYDVTDPAIVRSRVGLVHSTPVMLMVHAVKEKSVPLFEQFPIQSDYTVLHQSAENPELTDHSEMPFRFLQVCKNIIHRCVGDKIWLQLQSYRNRREQRMNYSFSNARFYRRVK